MKIINNNTLGSIALGIAITAGASCVYAAQGNDRAGFDNLRGKVNRIFSHLDTDLSETITLSEWLARVSDRAVNQFDRIDTDDDELISLEEFLAVGSGRGDANLDIDPELVRACIEEQRGEALPERPDRNERFAEIDTNDDGFIDFDEFLAAKSEHGTARFNAIDTDGDGAITKPELAAALIGQRDRRAIRRDCVDEQRDMAALVAG